MKNNLLSVEGGKRTSLLRPQTFFEKKDQLIKDQNIRESSEQFQEELRIRADAMIDSIKAKKAKEQRVHIVLLYASPLVIKFQDENSCDR